MKLTLERATTYRYLLKNKKNEPIATFHIDDLWDTDYQELYDTVKNRKNNKYSVELKLCDEDVPDFEEVK